MYGVKYGGYRCKARFGASTLTDLRTKDGVACTEVPALAGTWITPFPCVPAAPTRGATCSGSVPTITASKRWWTCVSAGGLS